MREITQWQIELIRGWPFEDDDEEDSCHRFEALIAAGLAKYADDEIHHAVLTDVGRKALDRYDATPTGRDETRCADCPCRYGIHCNQPRTQENAR